MIEDLIRQAARESWEVDRHQWAAAGQPQPSWDDLPDDAKAFHMARAAIPVRVALMSSDAEIERLQTQRDTAISFIKTLYPIPISSSERAIAHRLFCEANGFSDSAALSGDEHE
jgi:hypothetical protein